MLAIRATYVLLGALSVVVLPPESVLLYAPHAGSFDARYFGPLNRSSVRAVVYPIWTVD